MGDTDPDTADAERAAEAEVQRKDRLAGALLLSRLVKNDKVPEAMPAHLKIAELCGIQELITFLAGTTPTVRPNEAKKDLSAAKALESAKALLSALNSRLTATEEHAAAACEYDPENTEHRAVATALIVQYRSQYLSHETALNQTYMDVCRSVLDSVGTHIIGTKHVPQLPPPSAAGAKAVGSFTDCMATATQQLGREPDPGWVPDHDLLEIILKEAGNNPPSLPAMARLCPSLSDEGRAAAALRLFEKANRQVAFAWSGVAGEGALLHVTEGKEEHSIAAVRTGVDGTKARIIPGSDMHYEPDFQRTVRDSIEAAVEAGHLPEDEVGGVLAALWDVDIRDALGYAPLHAAKRKALATGEWRRMLAASRRACERRREDDAKKKKPRGKDKAPLPPETSDSDTSDDADDDDDGGRPPRGSGRAGASRPRRRRDDDRRRDDERDRDRDRRRGDDSPPPRRRGSPPRHSPPRRESPRLAAKNRYKSPPRESAKGSPPRASRFENVPTPPSYSHRRGGSKTSTMACYKYMVRARLAGGPMLTARPPPNARRPLTRVPSRTCGARSSTTADARTGRSVSGLTRSA